MSDVFVFGSNRKGISGAGAALHARKVWGAANGVGEGPTGRAYALPTKATPYLTLDLAAVGQHVARFIDHARQHPEQRFLLTRIGCGLAQKGGKGLDEKAIAALFADAPDNVVSIDDTGQVIGPASRWGQRVQG